MTNESNQDPQQPTQDQPPPKQYATPQPGPPGERGTDERPSKTPGRVESTGDDDDELSADKGSGYDQDSLVKGTTKPGGGTGQGSGSGSRQSPGSGGSSGTGGSSGSSNPSGGQSDKK
jgi:hypothetical protein